MLQLSFSISYSLLSRFCTLSFASFNVYTHPAFPQPINSRNLRTLHANMAQSTNVNDIVAHCMEEGMGIYDSLIFASVALQQVQELTNASGGAPVTREQLAQSIHNLAHAEVLQEELDIAQHGEDAFKRAMIQLMRNHGRDDAQDNALRDEAVPWDPLFQDPGAVEEEEGTSDGARRKRFRFTGDGLEQYFGGDNPYELTEDMGTLSLKHGGHDILTALCQHVELAVEIGKHLGARDILNLFIANRTFNAAVSGHLLSCIRRWIAYRAPEAARIFPFNLYRRLLVRDPVGRTWEEQYRGSTMATQLSQWHQRAVRLIPGLRYLQLVLERDRYCSEVVAILARNGHRLPATIHRTLLRLWLLMELPTTVQRQAWLRDKTIWTDDDIYNCQFLFVKLSMHFNDPIYGPGTYDLLQLMMGQKGLFPLWQLLMRRKWTKLGELMELFVRYNMQPPDHWAADLVETGVHGVPMHDVGRIHLEGWGLGSQHLMRPDELIPVEAVARGLQLEDHLVHMVAWGYFDYDTGENAVPSAEEMYISDEENSLAHMDTSQHWKPKHALKARWDELTAEQRQEIIDDDEDERLRAMAWCNDDSSSDDDEADYSDDEKPYHPNDEMERGYVMPPPPQKLPPPEAGVPQGTDRARWEEFVNRVMIGAPAQLENDEALRAQAFQMGQQHQRFAGEFDWRQWIQRAQGSGGAESEPSAGSEGSDDTAMPDDEAGQGPGDDSAYEGDVDAEGEEVGYAGEGHGDEEARDYEEVEMDANERNIIGMLFGTHQQTAG